MCLVQIIVIQCTNKNENPHKQNIQDQVKTNFSSIAIKIQNNHMRNLYINYKSRSASSIIQSRHGLYPFFLYGSDSTCIFHHAYSQKIPEENTLHILKFIRLVNDLDLFPDYQYDNNFRIIFLENYLSYKSSELKDLGKILRENRLGIEILEIYIPQLIHQYESPDKLVDNLKKKLIEIGLIEITKTLLIKSEI